MKIMTLRAPEELQKALKEKAKEKGVTRNALVIFILNEFLKSSFKF